MAQVDPSDVMLDRDLVLPHRIARYAREAPDVPLVEDVEDTPGGRRFTNREFHDRFQRWADALRRAGVEAGQPVLTLLTNRADSHALWLGASWLGAIEAPLNTQFRGPILRYAIDYVGAELMVVHSSFLPILGDVAAELQHVRRLVVLDPPKRLPDLPFEVMTEEEFLAGATSAEDLPGPEYHDISCMIFTSGTTGPSKGVLMPWAELYEFPASMPAGTVEEGEGYYVFLPAFHAAGKVQLYIGALAKARTVIRETFNFTAFWSDLHSYGVTSVAFPGPLAPLLLQLEDRLAEDNPLRSVMMGPLIPELDEFRKRFGVEVSTAYGMTEIGVPLASEGFDLANNTSCGRVRSGYELRVVNEHDEPLGPDEFGELIVRHDLPWRLNAGYWAMPEQTAEAWRNGWFHTGDGFRYDAEGNYYFVDRIKDAIRRMGENISSFEVEAYVAEHPEVLEVAALGVPSEIGEEEVKVVVFADDLEPEELIEFLIPRMPRFMIPRYIEIVDDELPKTATMRVQKVKLRKDALNERTWDRVAAGVKLPRDPAVAGAAER